MGRATINTRTTRPKAQHRSVRADTTGTEEPLVLGISGITLVMIMRTPAPVPDSPPDSPKDSCPRKDHHRPRRHHRDPLP